MSTLQAGPVPLLDLQGIVKRYGPVEVLKGVDLVVGSGEVHSLLGQNGAGKSTLMKIVSGVAQPDGGVVRIEGHPVRMHGVQDSRRLGVGMVFQELSLVPQLTVSDNIWLGRERRRRGMLAGKDQETQSSDVLGRLGVDIDPRAIVGALPVGLQQLVEIAKVIVREPKIIVLDEPTASLDQAEVSRLFEVIGRLRDEGAAIVYISHHLTEVLEISDKLTVLRDGLVAATSANVGLDIDMVVEMMVGAPIAAASQEESASPGGDVLLEVRDAHFPGLLHGVDVTVRAGEVVGLGGLLGSGRTELLEGIMGLRGKFKGHILLRGAPVKLDPRSRSVRLLPEDRRTKGLILGLTVAENLLISDWRRIVSLGIIGPRTGLKVVSDMIRKLRIKTPSPRATLQTLSGGNQQKVLLGKALMGAPEVLLLDEPTAGIDVAAKAEILMTVRGLAASGKGILVVSSDLHEMAVMCDRVVVLADGQVRSELDRTRGDEISETTLLAAIQLPGGQTRGRDD